MPDSVCVAQDLGLRDHARLDGWVMLPMSFDGMEEVMPTPEQMEAAAAGLEIDHEATMELHQQREAEAEAEAEKVATDQDGLPLTAAVTLEAVCPPPAWPSRYTDNEWPARLCRHEVMHRFAGWLFPSTGTHAT